MFIARRAIDHLHAPYIIAEIGVNHDGNPATAEELVRTAAGVGADAVKFQLFRADMLMSRASRLAAYQERAGESDPLDMLRRLELGLDNLRQLVALTHAVGIHAIVTVFSVELVAPAAEIPWDAFKSASPDITNRPLLEAMASTGKPLIISTGASTIREVGRALGWLRDARDRTALLQCVSAYPTPDEHAELGGIIALREIFDGPVGYSDHTTGEETGALAVEHGACLLEKHFTYDRTAPGPDHGASLEPPMFARYAAAARRTRVVLNDPRVAVEAESPEGRRERERLARGQSRPSGISPAQKRVLPIEEDVRAVSRQSVTTTRPLKAGHVIARADLTIKRPGTGIPAYELDRVVGRRVRRTVEADMPLTPDDLDSWVSAEEGARASVSGAP